MASQRGSTATSLPAHTRVRPRRVRSVCLFCVHVVCARLVSGLREPGCSEDSGNSAREEANTPSPLAAAPRWVPGICNATYQEQLIMGDGRGAGGDQRTEEGAVVGEAAS